LSLWSKPPLGIQEITVALNPGTARKFCTGFRIRRQAAYSRYRVSIPGRVKAEHKGESAEVNGAGVEALKKLDVFAQMPSKHTGNAMFSKACLDTLSAGIFAVAMALLILDVRLPDDFHPRTPPSCCWSCSVFGRNSCLTSSVSGCSDCVGLPMSRCARARNIQPRIRQLVAVLSFPDHLRAVHRHRCRLLCAFRAGDLALCRSNAPDRLSDDDHNPNSLLTRTVAASCILKRHMLRFMAA
jgi:hypothetical protein